ncbi:ABC transporter substrate-binding protein [Microbacterium lushaniae]|nr:ABC transporter substrate-binding protein [Microbacterium lushaniae]KAA9156303.1 ABC transporter substrate-binding protein [Microbacterium lushaniae]
MLTAAHRHQGDSVAARKLIGVVAAAALLLTGCAAGGGGTDPANGGGSFDGEFIVYASLAVTGPLAGIAKANTEGLEAAVTDINANGGIDGREVKLIVGDDGADPTKAAQLLQEQLDKTDIDYVVAGNTSNVGLAMLPTLTREEIISSGQQAAINAPEDYPFHFGLVVPNETQIQAMVDEVAAGGYEKVALLHANDANGEAVSDTYKGAFETESIAYVDESFAPTDIDMTAQLQRLQAENPDVLVLQGLGSVAGYLLQSRTKIGWDIPTLGHSDFGSTDLAAVSSKADWNNVKVMAFASLSPDEKRTAGYETLRGELEKMNSALDQPISQYAVMWDMLHLAKYAWEKAGDGDVRDVYESLNVTADPDSAYAFKPYYKYSAEMHQLIIQPQDALTFLAPGPFVDGLIKSE